MTPLGGERERREGEKGGKEGGRREGGRGGGGKEGGKEGGGKEGGGREGGRERGRMGGVDRQMCVAYLVVPDPFWSRTRTAIAVPLLARPQVLDITVPT